MRDREIVGLQRRMTQLRGLCAAPQKPLELSPNVRRARFAGYEYHLLSHYRSLALGPNSRPNFAQIYRHGPRGVG